MTFIEKNLAPNEDILYQSKLHWMIYFGAAFWFVFGAVIYFIFAPMTSVAQYAFLAFALLSAYKFGAAFVQQISTELAVTDQRFIAKFGFVAREVIEIPLLKIESVVVDQSVLGRIVDSGSVAIHGTGSSMAPVHNIDSPVLFRNELNKAIAAIKDGSQSQ